MKNIQRICLCLTALTVGSLFLSACGAKASDKSVSGTRDDLLGTVITLTAYDKNGERAIDRSFGRIADIHRRMTTGEGSEIAELNERSGAGAVALSSDTFALLVCAGEVSRSSGGAFDVTIGPLVRLWDVGGEAPTVPERARIEDTLSLVDYSRLELDRDNESAFLSQKGMSVDLGGIAKGYACDESVRIFLEDGVSSALLDLGGNIYGLGRKPDGSLWKVGVRNPVIGEDGVVGSIQVSDRAVVTSGINERYFIEDGVICHHILDPGDGRPADNGLLSVTIINESSVIADALSTACFVLGMEKGRALLGQYPGTEGIFITDERKILVTDGLKDSFELLNSGFSLAEQ